MPFLFALAAAALACLPATSLSDPLFGETVLRFEASSTIEQLVLSPDGRRVAYAYFDASDAGTYVLEVRRVDGGRPIRLAPRREYEPCTCDGGVGAISWLDDRRLRVDAPYDTDDGDGVTRYVFDTSTGRLLSERDIPTSDDGPERRPDARSLRRAFPKFPAGFESELSPDAGFAADVRTRVLQIDAPSVYEHGLWAVDLPTSRKQLVAALDDGRSLSSGVAFGDGFVALLSGDTDDLVVVEGGSVRPLLQLAPSSHGGRGFAVIRNDKGRLVFAITYAGAAGEVFPSELYVTDGQIARRVAPDAEIYAASTDRAGRLAAVSTGTTAEIRRLTPAPEADRRVEREPQRVVRPRHD